MNTKADLEIIFESRLPHLVASLRDWAETDAMLSFDEAVGVSNGDSTMTVWDIGPAIDSKTVIDSGLIIEEILNIELPPEIIKPGGYESPDEMLEDIIPKLRQVFIGDMKVRSNSTQKIIA